MNVQNSLQTFEETYQKTYSDIVKYVICNCSNLEDVKDIVQEVYLSFYKRIDAKKDIDNVESFLIGIAKNKVKDYYHFRYKEKLLSLFSKKDEFELIEQIPANVNIPEIIIHQEQMDFVWKYLKSKKITVARIFYLYYQMDYPLKKIADELNMTESNVKNVLYRTLKELNRLIQKESEGNES